MSSAPAAIFFPDPAPEAWLVVLPAVLCLVMGAVLAAIRRNIALHAPIAIASLAVLCAVDALLLHRVLADGPLVMVMGRWLPPFGIAFTVDVLGAALALVAALVALAAAFVFARLRFGWLRVPAFFIITVRMFPPIIRAYWTPLPAMASIAWSSTITCPKPWKWPKRSRAALRNGRRSRGVIRRSC